MAARKKKPAEAPNPFNVEPPVRDCKNCGVEGKSYPDSSLQSLMPGENNTKMWRCGHCGEAFEDDDWA